MNNIYIIEEAEISAEMKKAITDGINEVCKREKLPPVSISVLICGKEEIKELNLEKRNINSPTDVLSFPNLEFDENFNIISDIEKEKDPENGSLILGDMAICTEVVREHAEEYGHSPEKEIKYMAVHSMYHLLGYDHMTDEDKRKMREKEKAIIE